MQFALTLSHGQSAIRAFLKVRTSHDVLPLSFRLIVFDTGLTVKESLNIMVQNGKSFNMGPFSKSRGDQKLIWHHNRYRLCAPMGFQDLFLRRASDHL